jgi:hypothetical protein
MPPTDFTRLAAANTPLLTKIAIGKISEILVSSPAARAEFSRNPSGFFEKRLGARPSAAEKEFLTNLQKQIADGFCCGGCACGPSDPGAIVTTTRGGRIR